MKLNARAKQVNLAEPKVEPIADILGRVGRELDTLAEQLNHVQGLISPLASQASALDPCFLQEIQVVDHIEQKMICLSHFLTSLGPLLQGHWVLDVSEASSVVSLSELARRLREAEHPAEEEPSGSGNFELF